MNHTEIRIILLLSFLCLLLLTQNTFSDQRSRAIIDTLRWGFDYKSAEASRRANRAQQLDSTYYISYLIEGYHYFEKAEEHTGLAKAVEPLKKALDLFENDFSYCLGRNYTQEDIFSGEWRNLFRQLDYFDLSNRLINCYISLEQPEEAYRAVLRLKKADFAYDFQSFHWLAWLYFRTRIYTGDEYLFLKNSIEENLRAAFDYTDSLELKLEQNEPYIRSEILGSVVQGSSFYNAFEEAFLEAPRGVIANNLGILYGYNLRPDLAAGYFKKMDDEESLARTVNLGFTYHSNIDFRTAEEYFSNVPDLGSRSRGGHWQGYSTIFVYKDNPLDGALELQQDRDKHGFTIGYGWDNLCLARMYLYSGFVDECRMALDKADKFTEVHYNTSFREDQYRFMLKTLRLLQTQYEIQEHKFEHKNQWLSIDWWKDMPKLLYQKYTNLYQLANELAANPERDLVYYHIFHTESIISFDELWLIIKNYNNNYFKKTFRRLAQEDPRQNLGRYYNYFTAKLLMEEGKYETAYDVLTSILTDPKLDKEYERLLIARIHENGALIAEKEGWEPQKVFHLNELYRSYPQLIPYSDVRMVFRLELSDELKTDKRPEIQSVLDQVDDCNIEWNPPERETYPEVKLNLGDNNNITYQVIITREVFTRGVVDISRPDAGKELAYRLFKILR
jgi:hypothetical protein